MPRDYLPGEQVNNYAQIIPFPASPDIREITDPDKIRSLLCKELFQVILAVALACRRVNEMGLNGGHSRQLHGFYQAVHSADADFNAIITFQYIGNLVSTESFLVVSVDVEYVGFNDLVFQTSGCRSRMEVLVVCTAVYTQDFAQDFDVVLESELMNGV